MPNRGDIWPANVAAIALPPAGTEIHAMTECSPRARYYLENFQESMLKPKEEIMMSEDVPYVDPNLDGNWVKFDDDRVTPVDAAVVAADADGTDYRNGASVGAYLLQYVRKKDAADLGYTGAQTCAES